MVDTLRKSSKESTTQKYLIDRVKAAGGKAEKIVGPVGTPDTLVKMPDRPACLVEVKRRGFFPDNAQLRQGDAWEKAGLEVYWVDSKSGVDWFVDNGIANHMTT